MASLFAACLACAKAEPQRPASSKEDATAPLGEHTSTNAQSAPSSAPRAPTPPPQPSSTSSPALACPPGMARIGGGRFWMGSERGKFASDEEPRFQTDVPSYCLDTTEVTVSAYQLCVKSGRCQAAHSGQFSCNTRDGEAKPGRDNHPINCVDYTQAAAFCAVKGARLPTEAEWEYAARGGDKLLTYPWGEGSPDGRACWKHAGTCSVRSFPAFEFGIYDLSGNVWEWVQDWYGPYPWPALYGFSRVYRGGSFSRRFEKWMHTRLRNREKPEYWGSHLGFRCAASVPGAPCPAGKDSTTGTCLATVSAVECPPGKEWNGARCARPGDAKCRPGFSEKAGHGCVLPEQAEVPPTDLSSAGISRTRTPNFDADCATYKKGLPLAFQYVGGTHAARNLVSHRAGCKNRDVGNGWNSVCCPSP